MGRMILGVPNILDRLSSGALSLGTWSATAARANILEPEFAVVARTDTDATTDTQIGIDLNAAAVLGNPPGAQILAIPRHNLTKNALIRVKAGTSAFTSGGGGGGSIAYDSGWIAALPTIVYPAGTLPWGHVSGWTLERDPVMDVEYNHAVVVKFGATIGARYWWIGFDDTANPDTYIEIARMFLGSVWVPSVYFDVGADIAFDGERVTETSSGNVAYNDRTPLRRVVTVNLSMLPDNEALSFVTAIAAYLSYDRQAFFMWDEDDTVHKLRRSFMVTQRVAPRLVVHSVPTTGAQLVLAEVL